MKYVLGFLLGIAVATAGQLMAQQSGTYMDEYGNQGVFNTAPGGAIQYMTPGGQMGTIYQGQPIRPDRPC